MDLNEQLAKWLLEWIRAPQERKPDYSELYAACRSSAEVIEAHFKLLDAHTADPANFPRPSHEAVQVALMEVEEA